MNSYLNKKRTPGSNPSSSLKSCGESYTKNTILCVKSVGLSSHVGREMGIEPTHNGATIRCLTTWLHPS